MSGWVPNLWVFGVSVGFDPYRHWVYLVQGIQSEHRFEGKVVGWRAIEDVFMPPFFSTTMAVIANSMSITTNDLDHGPIQCLMSNGLEPESRILQIQTI
jgi:hypothetical protein